jgi:hypothetical protein
MKNAVQEIMAKGMKRAMDMALLPASMAMGTHQRSATVQAITLGLARPFASAGFDGARYHRTGDNVCCPYQFACHIADVSTLRRFAKKKRPGKTGPLRKFRF